MARTLVLSLFLYTASAVAQNTPATLLWRITGHGAQATSYLYGTIHSQDERAFQFGDSVMPALLRSTVVGGELDLNDLDTPKGRLMQAMFLPGGKRLEEFYRKKDQRIVAAAMKEQFSLMAPFFERVKPFFIMAMMTDGSMREDRPRMVDDELMTRAQDNGQRTFGIETLQEQLSAMDAIPVQEQADMLLEHIKNGKSTQQMDDMHEAYARQDLDALYAVMEEGGSMPLSMEQALFTERNLRMVHRMDSVMQAGEAAFFLVGAGHLPRAGGLITLLQEKGYTVEPVFSVATKPDEWVPEEE